MAMNYPLRIEAGATYSRTFILKNKSDNTLYNITGATAAAQIRQYPSSDLALELAVSIDEEASSITIRAEDVETSDLVDDKYFWGMELYLPSETIRLIEGVVTVSPEVVY